MLYAALGDSITYGYCSSSIHTRYASRFAKLIHGKQGVNLFVHARPGWTSAKLLESLQTIPPAVWDETMLVTLMIGGNDLLRSIPWLLHASPGAIVRVSDGLHRNITQILTMVNRPQTTLMLATLYNPFPHSPVAARYTEALNEAVRSAAECQGAILADVGAAFQPHVGRCIDGYRRGRLSDFRMVGNPIHPNDEGHQLIAQVFHSAYRKAAIPSRRRHAGGESLRSLLSGDR